MYISNQWFGQEGHSLTDVLSAAQVPNPGMTVTPSKGSAGKCSCITPKQGRLGSKNVPVREKCGKLAEVQMKYFFFF